MTLHVAVINRHPLDTIGGSELQCDLFARGLVGRGHTVTYIALHAGASTEEAVASGSWRAADPPYALVALDAAATHDVRRIIGAVRECGADVVYWRFGRQGLDTVAAGLAEGHEPIPVVLAVAHVDDVTRWVRSPLVRGGVRDRAADVRRRLRHRRSWRAFRHVAAIAAQRADFLGRAPVALQQHIPNVVDPSATPFVWPRPYVAWVANLKERKRPEQLVPLARALATEGIDLLVVGGVQDERYRGLAEHDPKVSNLHPLGLLPPAGAAGLIAGARCLAVTARPEGLSNAMIQAWWHGVPTVSLDYDPDGMIASHGLGAACGGDTAAFHAAVLAHADGGGVARAAGSRARSFAQDQFAIGRNVPLLAALLLQVAHPGDPATVRQRAAGP
jgi:glycosyltransferase involved in cell wall biosynthesis